MMIAKAKHCCPAVGPKADPSLGKGEAEESDRCPDRRQSTSIEIDGRVYIQVLAAQIDLEGEPDSGRCGDK